MSICPECNSSEISEGYFSNGYVSGVKIVGDNPLKPSKLIVEVCKKCGLVIGMRAKNPENL